ncbi:MAG: AAA family ATPase [Saprospiraceae bacterium]
MRIKKLELKNFRGFEELTIDFPEGESGLAVFVGVNGAGKSSVLEGIIKLLHSYFSRLYEDPIKSGQKVERNELGKNYAVKVGATIAELKVMLDVGWEKFKIEENIDLRTGLTENSIEPRIGVQFLKKENWTIELENRRLKLFQNPFLIAYYSSKRNFPKEIKLVPKDISIPNLKAAFESAFLAETNYEDFLNWFRNTEDIENRKRLREDDSFRITALEVVRNAITTFIPSFSNPHVDTTQFGEEIMVEKSGQKFSISQLSDGEKLLITLIGDIARRLSIINSKAPLSATGIILIDEIEQHLHPGWQRTIIPNLRRTFPNIQFIVTTHSPQVLSNVPKENVFILEDFKLVEKTPYTYGRDSNSILWDLFAVRERPEKAQEDFSKLSRLMNDPKNDDKAKKLLAELAEKYGDDDDEVVRARLHFEFLTEG